MAMCSYLFSPGGFYRKKRHIVRSAIGELALRARSGGMPGLWYSLGPVDLAFVHPEIVVS
jgi:hypothetical protein